MRVLMTVLAATLLLAGCGSTTDDFDSANILQRTVLAGEAADLVLLGGGSLDIPAGTFDENTVVIISNFFGGGDLDYRNYPTPSPAAEDVLASMVVNTPVDALFAQNVTLTFPLEKTLAPAASAALAGEQYKVYRFDFDQAIWNQWGGAYATVSADAKTATAVLPTDGFMGFVGSLALFNGMQAGGAVAPTTISGSVLDESGNPVSTDVALFLSIGGVNYPVPLSNGRVPQVTYGTEAATIANTVDSAADGSFTMELPENLIGQRVSIEFGFEDDSRATQDHFDVLAPAVPVSNVESFSVRYGANNIVSRGVV